MSAELRSDLSAFLVCDVGVVSADRFATGGGDDGLPIKAFRDVLLDEDPDYGCSGLVGSRSFTFASLPTLDH